jgi:hypothetical protein
MTFKDCKNAGSCGKDLCLPEFCHQFDPIQKTNAERIREMSDEELAHFITDRLVAESCHRINDEGYKPTAIDIEAIRHRVYCHWMQWLRLPAEVQ